MNAATATKGFCLCFALNNTSLSIRTRDLLNVTTGIKGTMIKPLYDDTAQAILGRKSTVVVQTM